MKEYQEITNFFEQKGPEDIERFVDKNLDISQQVFALLEEKGWKQSDLAEALGKTNAEVSKWLSGMHNLTLRSIAKMEAALGADIIMTPKKAMQRYKEVEYVTLKVHANRNEMIPAAVEYKETEHPKWQGKRILKKIA